MALKQSDIDKVGKFLRVGKLDEWPVNDNLKVAQMASGSYAVLDGGGGSLRIEDLSAAQEAAIRKEFNLGESGEYDFDNNPLIPSDTLEDVLRDQKRKGKKSEFDTNPLIPD